jgi:hypothetical protein
MTALQFYRDHSAIVPSLVGPVETLRQIMLNTKMSGQSKIASIDNGLIVQNHVAISGKGVETALRTYIPITENQSLPVML